MCNLQYNSSKLYMFRDQLTRDQLKVSLHTYRKLQSLHIASKPHRAFRAGKQVRAKKYVHSTTVKTSSLQSQNNTTVCLMNSQSVRNKVTSILDHIIDHKLDIVIITETWLTSDDHDKLTIQKLTPSGYKFLPVHRKGRKGGGLGVIYKSALSISISKPRKLCSLEYMELNIDCGTSSMKVPVVYRLHRSKKLQITENLFFSEFEDILEDLVVYPGHLIIMGDFNFHWDVPSDTYTRRLMGLFESLDLVQHVSEPTHISGHTIDYVITKNSETILRSVSVSSLISDHHAVHCSLDLKKPHHMKKQIVQRNYKTLDQTSLAKELDCLTSEITSLPMSQPVNDLILLYNNLIKATLDKHAPEKTRTITLRPTIPWINDDLKAAKQERRKAERRWRHSRLTIHREIYVHCRAEVRSMFNKAKSIYFSNKIDECGNDQKAIFKVLDTILHKKTEKALPPHTDPKQLAETFSVFFVSKIKKIRDTFEPTQLIENEAFTGIKLLNFEPTTEEEVTKIIMSSATKSSPLDPMPTWLLKSNIKHVVPAITHVINYSLSSGVFPDCLKEATVTPLLKKSNLDPSNLKNYRPVSNLSFISKTLERVVAARLSEHVGKNTLYERVQSAYRPAHSTETALLHIQNVILQMVDKGSIAILVLLDLSAAFDTVDHNILLSRLQHRIGIAGTAHKWFKSYLTDRKQCVSINGQQSSTIGLQYGVPQGSVLGPVLFTLYTTPIGEIIRKHHIEFHIYADDTQLVTSFDPKKAGDMSKAIKRMECCIAEIKAWMSRNQLKLNDDKTELMLVSSPHQKSIVNDFPGITIGSTLITPKSIVRNLGATFDSQMSMEPYVNNICRAAYYHLRNICSVRHCLTKSATETLVHSLIASKLDYGNALLHGLPNRVLGKLQRVQNSAARVVAHTKKRDHITPVLKDLHWLPVKSRIVFKILIMSFKALQCPGPVYIKDLLHQHHLTRELRSTGNLRLTVPRTRLKTYGDRAFSHAAPVLWNSLPVEIQNQTLFTSFKTSLKTHLFGLAY